MLCVTRVNNPDSKKIKNINARIKCPKIINETVYISSEEEKILSEFDFDIQNIKNWTYNYNSSGKKFFIQNTTKKLVREILNYPGDRKNHYFKTYIKNKIRYFNYQKILKQTKHKINKPNGTVSNKIDFSDFPFLNEYYKKIQESKIPFTWNFRIYSSYPGCTARFYKSPQSPLLFILYILKQLPKNFDLKSLLNNHGYSHDSYLKDIFS